MSGSARLGPPACELTSSAHFSRAKSHEPKLSLWVKGPSQGWHARLIFHELSLWVKGSSQLSLLPSLVGCELTRPIDKLRGEFLHVRGFGVAFSSFAHQASNIMIFFMQVLSFIFYFWQVNPLSLNIPKNWSLNLAHFGLQVSIMFELALKALTLSTFGP